VSPVRVREGDVLLYLARLGYVRFYKVSITITTMMNFFSKELLKFSCAKLNDLF